MILKNFNILLNDRGPLRTSRGCYTQSFIILLIVMTILIPYLIKAKKKFISCRGKLYKRNETNAGIRKAKRIYHNLEQLIIPERFDAREEWPFCKSLQHIKYQGECGGCWAFAATSVMSDRLCIATRGKYDIRLSEQDLLECCTTCVPIGKMYAGGCEGGYVENAFEYWKENGVVTGNEGCKPTEETISKGIPYKECRAKCTNKKYPTQYKKDKTFGIKVYKEATATENDIRYIMAEILINGPVVASIIAYDYLEDAQENDILVYNASAIAKDEEAIEHAVKLIGWDNISGIPVWTIANSWGTRWCNEGFCHVKRGDLGIEDDEIVAGLPKLKKDYYSNVKKTGKVDQTSGSNVIKITNSIETVIVVILCILKM